MSIAANGPKNDTHMNTLASSPSLPALYPLQCTTEGFPLKSAIPCNSEMLRESIDKQHECCCSVALSLVQLMLFAINKESYNNAICEATEEKNNNNNNE